MFHQTISKFAVADPGLVIDPAALAAALQSLDSSGLLLLGEVHGVRENPLLIRALMQALGLTSLALEWPEDLAPMINRFLSSGTMGDHWSLWSGDGRITAGHLAVLGERAAAGPLKLILFDGVIGADLSWSQRDEAMARRILAASPMDVRTLAVAGNAHTSTGPIELGVPMGARLARQRPGVREIRINYGGGDFYNGEPRHFSRRASPQELIRLYPDDGELVLDLPTASEAVVPQRPGPWPDLPLEPEHQASSGTAHGPSPDADAE
jgi:hypothetical protein